MPPMPVPARQAVRVLSVGNLYPPHTGGYELLWQAAVRHLRERGHAVRVLTTDLIPAGAESDPDVFRELSWYWRDYEWPPMNPRQRFARERHNARVFDAHVRSFRPDLIAWWAMGGMSQGLIEQARRRRLPAVGFVIDDWMAYGRRTDQWMTAWANRPGLARAAAALTRLPTRVSYGGAARWTFCSEVTRARAIDEAGPLADTGVLHPGVDPVFERDAAAKPWDWRLLYAGRVDPRKGIAAAVEALVHLPAEATLLVVGSGDERHSAGLRERVEALNLAGRVRFEPARDRAELVDTYAAADVTLFPVEWLEPWGLVPLEAMAVGRPVVATGQGGSGEYLRDGENCLLFAPGDPRGLADAVRRLAGDEALRAQLAAGGRRTSAGLSEQAWLEGVEREHMARATLPGWPSS